MKQFCDLKLKFPFVKLKYQVLWVCHYADSIIQLKIPYIISEIEWYSTFQIHELGQKKCTRFT